MQLTAFAHRVFAGVHGRLPIHGQCDNVKGLCRLVAPVPVGWVAFEVYVALALDSLRLGHRHRLFSASGAFGSPSLIQLIVEFVFGFLKGGAN
jgi:hypothetical protein